MGRFLLALSLLLVFVAATGFCQSFNSAQKSEIEEIVRNVVREELQSFYRKQPVPVLVNPAPVINISTNTVIIAPVRNELTELGLSRKEDIVALIASKNCRTPRRYIEDVVDTYIIEAKFERINHDIAIAQMLYATDYLNNEQHKTFYNYSGLQNERFCNMTTGIRAHIQHLKFYVYGTLVDSNRNVDPRYPSLKASQCLVTVNTLEDLCRRWSENPGYLYNIRCKLAEMTHFTIYRR